MATAVCVCVCEYWMIGRCMDVCVVSHGQCGIVFLQCAHAVCRCIAHLKVNYRQNRITVYKSVILNEKERQRRGENMTTKQNVIRARKKKKRNIIAIFGWTELRRGRATMWAMLLCRKTKLYGGVQDIVQEKLAHGFMRCSHMLRAGLRQRENHHANWLCETVQFSRQFYDLVYGNEIN